MIYTKIFKLRKKIFIYSNFSVEDHITPFSSNN